MYSPPPDEAADALARDPIDPVEATERFLEDAAADTDPPGKDEHTPHLGLQPIWDLRLGSLART